MIQGMGKSVCKDGMDSEQDEIASVGESDSQDDGSEYQDHQQPDSANHEFYSQVDHGDRDSKDISTYNNPQTEANRDGGDNPGANDHTLSELLSQAVFGEVEKIAKPSGIGGRNFNIRAHMRLDTDDPEDEQLYREIMVRYSNILSEYFALIILYRPQCVTGPTTFWTLVCPCIPRINTRYDLLRQMYVFLT